MKRIKLRNYVCGPNSRTFQVLELTGSTSEVSGLTEYADISTMAGYQNGSLNTIPSNTSTSIISGGSLYDIDEYLRKYAIEKTYNLDDGSLGTLGPSAEFSPIVDVEQFGDFIFQLSKETVHGTQFKKNIDGGPTDDIFYEGEPMHNTRPDVYTESAHEVGLYYPCESVSGNPELAREIDKSIYTTGFDFYRRKIVFGTEKDYGSGIDELALYVKSTGNSVDPYWNFPVSALVYGYTDGIQYSYLLEQNLNHEIVHDTNNVSGYVYINPFKLKNMYDYNFEMEIGPNRDTLDGLRNYLTIGKRQETLWLKYKYVKDYDYEFSNDEDVAWRMDPVQRFDMVERVKGLYKFGARGSHKSNIYSIEINNSELNEGIVDSTQRAEIQAEVEDQVRKIVRKIAPAYTQLWKVEFKGK